MEKDFKILKTKTCVRCGEVKPYSEFTKHKLTKDGLQPYCKECCSEYYNANKEHYSQYHKQYRLANADHLKQYKRQWNEANKHNDLYVVFSNNICQYVGATTKGINARFSQHKHYNSFAGKVAKGEELGKILFIRLDAYDLTMNELRYIEQCFIDAYEPIQNIKNACIELDFIEGDRLAYLMGLSQVLINNFDDIATTYINIK